MRLTSSKNRRTLIAIFIVLAIIAETGAYLMTTSRPQEQFFQVYVLGKNGLAADYYPQNDTDIHVATHVPWFVGVTNSMGKMEFVEMRIKLGNQSTAAPSDTSATPSSAPELTAFDRFLSDNETWEFAFVWSIMNATKNSGSTRILEVQVNNETYFPSDWSASNGYNFRVILELWVWQTDMNAFEFGWSSNGEQRTAWLQLWFNMTTPGPPPVSP